MEKGKRLKSANGETLLPEVMIQHIQSFMNGKEAAQTTILSKSWYKAWLTRPTLALDQYYFKKRSNRPVPKIRFAKFATKTMQRYQDSNLKIESFSLRTQNSRKSVDLRANKLIVSAVKMGATDLNLDLRNAIFGLPREVLESETLVRLYLCGREIEINHEIRCSRLKFLSLYNVHMKNDIIFGDIISSCVSIEELSLSYCTCLSNSSNSYYTKLELNPTNMFELHKLRRLHLKWVRVDPSFFSDFATRFPCLKDLSIVRCHGYTRIKISSTSLERIAFVQLKVLGAEFGVPSIRKFSYSGVAIPSLSFKSGGDREWESRITITCRRSHTFAWLRRLSKLLSKLRPSRISDLSINLVCSHWKRIVEEEVVQALPKLVQVEDLTIEAQFDSGVALLVDLDRACRQKIVTSSWLSEPIESYDLCRRLMKRDPNAFRRSVKHFCLKIVTILLKDFCQKIVEKLLKDFCQKIRIRYLMNSSEVARYMDMGIAHQIPYFK